MYSFDTSQSGQYVYPFFNEKGNINIKEETKFKNLINFGSYSKNNTLLYYRIDINGNIIYN